MVRHGSANRVTSARTAPQDTTMKLTEIPREVRLDAWPGPTVFSSDVVAGEAKTLAAFDARMAGHKYAAWLAIGSERETDEPMVGHAYSVFVMDPVGGSIAVVELDEQAHTRFVNSSLDAFFACTAVLVDAWPELEGLSAKMANIDGDAMANVDNYWPTALDTYAEG
jgi:SUKH-4 immunity protein